MIGVVLAVATPISGGIWWTASNIWDYQNYKVQHEEEYETKIDKLDKVLQNQTDLHVDIEGLRGDIRVLNSELGFLNEKIEEL